MLLEEGTYFGEIKKTFESKPVKVTTTLHASHAWLDLHQHSNPYLSVLVAGSYIEYTNQDQFLLTPGSFIFRPAYYDHANEMRGSDCICCNLELKPDFVKTHNLPDGPARYAPGQFPCLDQTLHLLANNYFDYETYLEQWLCSSRAAFKETRLVKTTKDLVRDEYWSSLSLTIIADRIYVHPAYLARAFKKATGYTVGQYIRKVRIEKAVALMFISDLPITSLAYEAGFFDTAHFIKVFRSYYGLSPLQYRQSLKKLS